MCAGIPENVFAAEKLMQPTFEPKIARVVMSFQAIFIVGCGCDGIIRSLHYVPLTWFSHAGL